MMDSKITQHMPGKIERLGIRTHGLVKCPITVMPDGSEACYLRDYTITTRGGKTLPMPYSDADKDLSFPPKICPHPFLYMHPLAQMAAEDEYGNDWSGYVIFYKKGANKGYLNQFNCAFTPDDNSQALLFYGDIDYVPPQIIGNTGQSQTVRISGLAQNMYFEPLLYVSEDGRYRISGTMGQFYDTDFKYEGPSWAQPVQVYSYRLDGDFTSGVKARLVSVTQPEHIYIPKEKIIDSSSGIVKAYVGYSGDLAGGCVVYEAQDPYSRFYVDSSSLSYGGEIVVKKKNAIGVLASNSNVSYLYLTATSTTTFPPVQVTYDISESSSFGDECSTSGYGPKNGNILTSYSGSMWEKTREESKRVDEFEVSGWGSTSSIIFEIDEEEEYTRTYDNSWGAWGDSVRRSWYRKFVIRLTFEGTVIYTKELASTKVGNEPAAELIGWTRWPRGAIDTPPAIIQDADTWSVNMGAGERTVGGSGYPEERVSVNFGILNLAEGIKALFVYIVIWDEVDLSGNVDMSSVKSKLYLGRIFGYGTSRAGMEIPNSMWDKKIYAAYDPISKTISDIYTHPVFYQ